MAMNINSAINAYQSAAQSAGSGAAAKTPLAGGEDPTTTFAGLVRDSIAEAVDVNRHAEEMSIKGISGEADMRDVVLAVANAEQALNTVVAVRDKVVTAYQEILKMPI